MHGETMKYIKVHLGSAWFTSWPGHQLS